MQFLNYFKAIQRSPRPKSQPVALFVAGYFIFFFGIYMFGANGLFSFLASLAFAAGMIVCYWCNSKPNLETVFPLNHKKKLLYRFLSSLLMFLIMTAFAIAAMAVVALITITIVSITSGGFGWIYDEEFNSDVSGAGVIIFGSMGVYGGLFGLAYFVILYSAGMITGFIKKRKTRNIYLTCLCFSIALSFLLMVIPYIVKTGGFEFISPFSKACYEAMGAPWLCITIWLLIAAGMLGAAVYLGIKHYDPKKF